MSGRFRYATLSASVVLISVAAAQPLSPDAAQSARPAQQAGEEMLPRPLPTAVPAAPNVPPPGERASLQDVGSPPASASLDAADELNLSNAEKLSVKVRGNADLSGDYRVDAENTISIPVLGRVKVSSLTPATLEQRLDDQLADMSGREAFVTVEIAEYRPVFVTGYVTQSGSAHWRPGMTVLHAVALSGGVYRPAEAVARAAQGSVEAEQTRVKRALSDLKFSLAVLARLQAEHEGADHIRVPERLVALEGPTEAEADIRTQESLFNSRRTAYENHIAAMENGMALAGQELGALTAQSGRLDEQLRLRRDNRDKVERLQQEGIVVASRSLEEKIKVSEAEDKQTSVAVAIARVQGMTAELKRDLMKAKLDRHAEVEGEMDKTQRDIAQFEIELGAGKAAILRTEREIASSMPHDNVIQYSVMRKDAPDNVGPQPAMLSTKLKPGDVVMVSIQPGP